MGVIVRQKVPGKGKPWWIFIAHNGKRTSRMVGSKTAAENVASKIQAKLQLGEFDFEPEGAELKMPTFKEYADLWIKTTAPANCKDSTLCSYQELLRLHVLPTFGGLRLNDINRGKVKDFFAAKTLEGYTRSSVSHMKATISNILNNAVDNEIIPTNVSLGIKLPQKKNGGKEDGDGKIDTLTAEETNLFLETVREYFPRDYPLCLLLLRTGMRIGEAFALRWGDVDFNMRFIHVQRGLSRKKIETPKSGKSRRVDMSQQLAETLAAYRVECKKKGFALGLGDAPEYIFTNERGGLIIQSNWRKRVFWKALEKAGLRRIRIHDLRHTYATLRISKGDSITDVSNQLGHYSVKLTLDVYNHWLPGGEER